MATERQRKQNWHFSQNQDFSLNDLLHVSDTIINVHLLNSFCQNSFSSASSLASLLQLNGELHASVFGDLKPGCSVEREQKLLKYRQNSPKSLKASLITPLTLINRAMPNQNTIKEH